MSKKKLLNSPGFEDKDDRQIVIDNDILFFGFKIISTPEMDLDIDLRREDDLSVGIEVERPRGKCGYDWWDSNNLHYSTLSRLGFKTVNIAYRKHHYWQEYEERFNNRYNPSFNKNYFVRMTEDRSCIIIISPEVILDLTKRHDAYILPSVVSYGELEYFWCFKEEDVKTFLLQEDGTYKLKPYIKEDINETIRKSNMARRARELHARKNQESKDILSEQV
jgi:hypothetical protein